MHRPISVIFDKTISNTQINEDKSDDIIVNIDISHGTLLGSLLFIICIIDLLLLNTDYTKGNVYSLTDDTVVMFSGNNWENVFEKQARKQTDFKMA